MLKSRDSLKNKDKSDNLSDNQTSQESKANSKENAAAKPEAQFVAQQTRPSSSSNAQSKSDKPSDAKNPSTPHPKRPLPPMQKSLRLNAAAKRKLTPKPLIFLRAQPLLQRQKNLQRQRPQVKQTLPLQQIRRQIQQPPVSRNQTQHLLTRILRRLNVVESQKLFSHLIHRQTTKPRS